MPILTFYVLELKTGCIALTFYETFIFAILIIPGNPLLHTVYEPDFISRFIASLISLSILAFAYEYTRQDWQNEITELNSALERMSRTDELTGLTNRRDMKERMIEEVSRFKKNRHPFCLAIGDIDHFKEINDKYGHDCGDSVLRQLSNLMRTITKEQDIVSRWGG